MRVTHAVKLELLRHGRSYNQLLSPLTRYLGLSGRHEAVTLNVPYEHYEFMSRLRAMRYEADNKSDRPIRLQEMGTKVGMMLGKVPGLLADLRAGTLNDREMVHLRLVFSASELALLPFELSLSPAGFPGEGRPLSLQLDTPLVMTREIRAATGYRLNWNRKALRR